jgi:hypothetical protein
VFRSLRSPAERAAAAAILAAVVIAASCRPSRLQFTPVPPEVDSIQGYGAVKIVRAGESGRTRFSFVLETGRRGKLEVLDALNRTAAEIFLAPKEAVLVLRGDKVYWRAAPEDVIERFIGVRLGLDDVTGLLRGRPPAEAGIDFEIRETFPGGSAPRRIEFTGITASGTITILALSFNIPAADSVFSLDFLAAFSARTWDEIERILRRED